VRTKHLKPALDGSSAAALEMQDLGLHLGGRCMALSNIPLLLTTNIVLQHQFKSSQRQPDNIAARICPAPMIKLALAAITRAIMRYYSMHSASRESKLVVNSRSQHK